MLHGSRWYGPVGAASDSGKRNRQWDHKERTTEIRRVMGSSMACRGMDARMGKNVEGFETRTDCIAGLSQEEHRSCIAWYGSRAPRWALGRRAHGHGTAASCICIGEHHRAGVGCISMCLWYPSRAQIVEIPRCISSVPFMISVEPRLSNTRCISIVYFPDICQELRRRIPVASACGFLATVCCMLTQFHCVEEFSACAGRIMIAWSEHLAYFAVA